MLLFLFSIMLNIIGAGLFLSFVYLLYVALKGGNARKAAKIFICFLLATIVCYAGVFIYSIKRQFSWINQQYSDIYAARYVGEEVAEVMERQYYLAGYRDPQIWFQSAWYDSVEDLADVMPFEDSNQVEAFISSVSRTNARSEFCDHSLSKVPANDGLNVSYYYVDIENMIEVPEQFYIGYYIVVNQDTSEASLVAYYVDT